MSEPIHALVHELLRADCFQSTAEAVLRPMLSRAQAALAASAYAQTGRLLRAMVHLRPEGGYRGLVVLEQGQERCAPLSSDDAMLPSLTAWRILESAGQMLSLDVMLALATPLCGEPISLEGALHPDAQGEAAFQSRARLLGREATHVGLLPLRLGPSQIVGMVSLEANCPQALGQQFVFADCARDLQLLADLAAPYLLSRPLRPAAQSVRTGDPLLPVVGTSMEGLIDLLRVFAQHNETIFLSGPTGTGKSRLARWCHAQSPRRDRPFEIADLSTVAPSMQMAELFGWRKGAFTGALADRAGWVTQAEGGTLFLDEIDKLSLEAQAGLLHLLEERRYRIHGDSGGARRADVRFMVGTNADLRAEVKEGRFRADLFYRMYVLPLQLPPLSERPEEIVPWTEYMLERRHREAGPGGAARLSSDAGLKLVSFPWPGSLRQLDNVVRRAYAMALIAHAQPAPPDGAPGQQGEALSSSADLEIRRGHIERALAFERGTEAATLSDLLRQAARAYAVEAERRGQDGGQLPLELAEAFAGLVLSAGVTLTGSRKEAFRLFDLGHMVESRNHHKAFERMAARVLAALEAAGEAPDPDIQSQLKE